VEQKGEVTVSGPRDLGTALREADWDQLLPRLVEHTERRLRRVRWGSTQEREPSAANVQQVINTAIERCLEGRRHWSEACPDLEVFMKGVIDSTVSASKKASVRDKVRLSEDGEVESFEERASVEDDLVAEAGLRGIRAAFEACLDDDPKLQELYLAILDGNVKREEIAEALGWDAKEVSAARIKLKRRLLSKFPEKFAKVAKDGAS
jgi:hypothetical protein